MWKGDILDRIPAFKELKSRKLCYEVESLRGFAKVQTGGREFTGGYTISSQEVGKGFLDKVWDFKWTWGKMELDNPSLESWCEF